MTAPLRDATKEDEMPDVPQVIGGIRPGDICVRSGLICGCGPNAVKKALTRAAGLSAIIHQPYNHSGLALDATTVHHVEANGYENLMAAEFYGDAIGGSVLRYDGPAADQVRQQVVDIVK